MDDRFDMILISQSILDDGGVSYELGTYTPYGNDGMHFNDSLNAPPNMAVGQEIADAIHYASDHIPLFAIFNFDEPVSAETEIAPTEYMLSQNYPNPFNPSTTIYYSIPQSSFVTLKVYDMLGSEITTLVNEEKPIGSYEVEFNATRLPSGIYFYRLQAGVPSASSGQSFVETKKMILMK